MASAKKIQYQKLLEQRIKFEGVVDHEQWPAHHSEIFTHIQKLGKTCFDQYSEVVTIEGREKPWRERTRARAIQVANSAKRCLEHGKNEEGWRLDVEPWVMARFDTEVVCKNCRARLWRSEIETALNNKNNPYGSLEERRERRGTCHCAEGWKQQDPLEPGLNLLFDNRAGEIILHDPDLGSAPGKGQRPDRIYGLQGTKRLNRLLTEEFKTPSPNGRLIRDNIQSSPLRKSGTPLHFPFLVLEAKSEKSTNGFSDIQMQTSFTIIKLLKLQTDLQYATSKDTKWETGPLVWFLSYRGEQWRVAAVHAEDRPRRPPCRVIDLWNGRIDDKANALQLLLILDYVFDWARDDYREAILTELRMLAANDTASLAHDSVALSTVDHVSPWLETPSETDGPSDAGSVIVSTMSKEADLFRLRFFDSTKTAIRDARVINSRFQGLYLNKEDLSQLFEVFGWGKQTRQLAQELVSILSKGWEVTGQTLDSVEALWTKEDRDRISPEDSDKVFRTRFSVSAYISTSWEPCRELSYVALADDAWAMLQERAEPENLSLHVSCRRPAISQDRLLKLFSRFKDESARNNLLAAFHTRCIEPVDPSNSPTTDMWTASYDPTGGCAGVPQYLAMGRAEDARVSDIFVQAWERHWIGARIPPERYFRISNRIEEQRESAVPSESIWGLEGMEIGQDENAVFLTSYRVSSGTLPTPLQRQIDKVSLYLLDGLPEGRGSHPRSSLKANLEFQFQLELANKDFPARPNHNPGMIRDHQFGLILAPMLNQFEKVIANGIEDWSGARISKRGRLFHNKSIAEKNPALKNWPTSPNTVQRLREVSKFLLECLQVTRPWQQPPPSLSQPVAPTRRGFAVRPSASPSSSKRTATQYGHVSRFPVKKQRLSMGPPIDLPNKVIDLDEFDTVRESDMSLPDDEFELLLAAGVFGVPREPDEGLDQAASVSGPSQDLNNTHDAISVDSGSAELGDF